MRILYLIPFSILAFYLSWQTLDKEQIISTKSEAKSPVAFNSSPVNSLLFVCDRRSDSLELVKFYNATGGPNWWKKWDLKKSMDFWFGISLNSEGCVSGIYLGDTFNVSGYSGNNLIGLFVPLNLPTLKDLYLLNNKLTGNLSSFENLRSLELLNIYGNQFNGSIPNFDFQSLKSLVIASNKLSGGIPQFNKLPKLEYLGIAIMDSISGPLLDFDLPMLKGLELHQLSITGEIPNFTKMPSLEWFQIYDTKQISRIPNFSYLPKLKSLLIGAQLYGQIPDFNKMPKLESLQLGGTNHTPKDPIPDFTNLPELKYLNLGDMDLTGSIPEFKKCPLLEDIRVRINNLSGNIPDYYKTHPNLNSLNIDNNKFTFQNIIYNLSKNRAVVDSILYAPQKCIYADTTISVPTASNYTLDLKIDDTVTSSTYTWSKDGVFYKTIKGINKLTFLLFTNNDAGTYTVKITNPLAPQLTLESCPIRLVAGPSLICDRRSDSLELVKFYNATGGTNWTVKWDLSKPITTWHGIQINNVGCVVTISLQQNNLTGSLLDLNLSALNILDLPINKIGGNLPAFKYVKNISTINLRGNAFMGTVPNLDSLSELVVLSLLENRLSGSVPVLSKNKKIKELQLAHNNLKGFLPDNSVLHPLIILNTINDNRLTFEHIIQNVQKIKNQIEIVNGQINRFFYAPQQKIYVDTTITIQPNTNYTLDLRIDDTVTTSTYTWYKNGVLDTIIKGKNKLPFAPFTSNDAGTYTVKITNPHAPQLTLESWPIRLVIAPNLLCDRGSDSLELVKFYNATGGPNWWKKWDLKKPLDTWFGISLNSEGCVVSIKLNDTLDGSLDIGNNLNGVFIDFKLPFLATFDIRGSKISNNIIDYMFLPSLQNLLFPYFLIGTLPNFSNLPELRTLFLENNNISGTIPDFKNCSKLQNLYLGQNDFNGTLPDFNLPDLRTLRLDGSDLTGTIPNFSKMPKLAILRLTANRFSGSLPNFINCPKLSELHLSVNSLEGQIPNYNNLTELKILALAGNMLSGPLPPFDSNSNLIFLSVTNNKLSGYLSSHQANSKLSEFGLDGNSYTFSGLIDNISKIRNTTNFVNNGCCYGDSLTYAPQDSFYTDTIITISPNTNYTLDLRIDDTVTTSTYTWYKNGVLDTIIKGKNKLPFAPFTSNDVGTYTVKITNPHAPQLTLESWQIRLTTSCVQPSFITPNISTLSCKSSGHKLPEISNIITTNARYFTLPNRQGTSYAVGTILYDSILLYANDFSSCSPNTTQIEKTYLVRISERPKVSISILQQLSCANSKDGRLSPDFSKIAGIGPFSFTWLGEGVQIGNTLTGVGILPSRLVVTDSKGCTDTASVTLKPLIDNNIVLKPDQQKGKNKTPQLFDVLTNDNIPAGIVVNVTIDNAQNGIMIYSLTTGKGTYEPKTGFSGKEKLTYKVCPVACPTDCQSSTIEFEVESPCADKTNLVLPNVIFPDGPTGANRYFFVEALEKCKEAFGPRPTKLSVYNRWGDLVFYSKDYLNNWEGTNTQGQPLPAGTYYYLLDLGSQAAPVKGYVVIMR